MESPSDEKMPKMARGEKWEKAQAWTSISTLDMWVSLTCEASTP
jgi:hypothetical protein